MTDAMLSGVYVVTGAASGIGERVALGLAARGAHLALIDNDDDAAGHLYRTIRGQFPKCNCVLKICDVADSAAVDQFAASVGMTFKDRLSGIINCASINPKSRPLHEVSIEQYKRVMSTNIDGTFNVCRAFIKLLVQQGSKSAPEGGYAIVNLGSAASTTGIEDSSVFCASKHAVLGLSRAIAKEYADLPIRCNVVAPGPLETPILQRLVDGRADISHIPLKRTGSVDEVAGVIMFLLSPAASYMTGSIIPVDGGWTA